MNTKLIIVSACVAGSVSAAHAQTWQMGLELVDQWSLFICSPTVSLKDRFWEFTLEGMQLSANGPDGVSWTTTVSPEGAFNVNFTGHYRPRDQRFAAEMKGNVHADPRWALLHNIDYSCWYKLVPK